MRYLIQGKTGYGKTTYIQSLLNSLNSPAIIFDPLNQLTTPSCLLCTSKLPCHSQCCVVFDHIDWNTENLTVLQDYLQTNMNIIVSTQTTGDMDPSNFDVIVTLNSRRTCEEVFVV